MAQKTVAIMKGDRVQWDGYGYKNATGVITRIYRVNTGGQAASAVLCAKVRIDDNGIYPHYRRRKYTTVSCHLLRTRPCDE